jgi:non-ribosomal peptide synthetase component F
MSGDDSQPAAPLLTDLFDRAAAAFPDAVAIDVPPSPNRPDRRVVTYRELSAAAEAVAARVDAFARADDLVAILLARDGERLYAAQLGVLKAGAAYVGVDPAFPDDRVRTLLDDARPLLLITDAAGKRRATAVGFDP